MFRRQLTALDYPSPDDVDIDDPEHFGNIVHWLEDQKIRLYPIDERRPLRQTDRADWLTGPFADYRLAIRMPEQLTQREQLAWLLNRAVRLDYLDAPATAFAGATAAALAERRPDAVPADRLDDPLDALLEPVALRAALHRVARRLDVPEHGDPIVRLQAIAALVGQKLAPAVRANRAPVGQAFALLDSPRCAFDDADVDQAAKILRLLQIHHVRELQTRINETIVAVQELTADPKTDSKLGRVGTK